MPAINIILYFYLYSFLGWLCESLYVSIARRKIINSGFLKGPLCPIYGFGAIIVVLLLTPLKSNPILVFILGVVTTSLLEYFTSYLLEKSFHMSWWDYSSHKYNINGRICLLNSTLFGIMSLVTMYILHPIAQSMSNKIDYNIQLLLIYLLLFLTMIDLIISTLTLINMNKELQRIYTHLQNLYEHTIINEVINSNPKLFLKLRKHHQHIKKAFPNITHKVYDFKIFDTEETNEKHKRK